MQERDKLLRKIQMYSFFLTDLHLYLDTHVTCKEALELFHKYKDLLAKAMQEYSEKFGPISMSQMNDKNTWTWVADPWPWERGE